MPSSLKRAIYPILFTIIGGLVGYLLFNVEVTRVQEHLVGYPDADRTAHQARPYLLLGLCFLPAVASVLHAFASTLDRYLTRELLSCFGICFTALIGMLLLLELQSTASDFKGAELTKIGVFYLTQLPSMLMMILPYSLMLSLLWCLGKMSKSQEIVSMIQSGRSVPRIMLPLIITGVLLTAATTVFSYHWAPYGEGYKDTLMQELKGDKQIAATNVGFGTVKDHRMWQVGIFPRNFAKGEPLENVQIYQMSDDGDLETSYFADTASWDRTTSVWTLSNINRCEFLEEDNSRKDYPKYQQVDSLAFDWRETPWQVIRPGLDPAQLGIPELNSWLKNTENTPLDNRKSYQTWWHFRWAQPAICLIIVLLAAPLGIAFTRRGVGGGVAVAIFLCAGMLFCSTVFPTLGESGHLPPALAAWATNILFFAVALVLFYRRMSGQPIYQTIRKILPF